jgi:hypothetical protein
MRMRQDSSSYCYKRSYRCQLPTNGTVSKQRLLLKSALEAQEKYKLISKLTTSTDSSTACVAVEAAIPCILHGGNWLGEKVFMMMLLEVWRCCYSTRQKQELVQVVVYFMNTGAFGSEHSRVQWKLPIDKECNLDAITFSAWRVRKILAILGDLADNLFRRANNLHRLPDWQRMLWSYMEVLTIAFQYKDFQMRTSKNFKMRLTRGTIRLSVHRTIRFRRYAH